MAEGEEPGSNLLHLDTSKNPIFPRLRSNQINNLAPAEDASGEVFRTLQVFPAAEEGQRLVAILVTGRSAARV